MSLTSYRAAPPRAKYATADSRGLDAPNPTYSKGVSKVGDMLRRHPCGWKTRQRPTLPCLKTKYHRRYRLSRPSSEWDRVGHLCHNHLVIQTHETHKPGQQRRRQCKDKEDIQNLKAALLGSLTQLYIIKLYIWCLLARSRK